MTSLLRYLIKIPILDFETVRFQFTENNNSKNPGVVGATGVTNLCVNPFVLVVSASITLVVFVVWFFFFAGAEPLPVGIKF